MGLERRLAVLEARRERKREYAQARRQRLREEAEWATEATAAVPAWFAGGYPSPIGGSMP